MGRCVSIYDCQYLFDILQSNTLTQQSIRFLQLSQCDAEVLDNNIPHVCCAKNDDNLTSQSDMNKAHLPALSALFTNSETIKDLDDFVVSESKNSRKILVDRSICGRETIEHRIYSGQVREDELKKKKL